MTEHLLRLFDASLDVAGYPLYWREIVGNLFGFASALGGLRRRVWAWPVGIVGNVLLFTVFVGAAFALPDGRHPLYGQAFRQVFFVATSLYGWWRWNQSRRVRAADAPAITPRWATGAERRRYLIGVVVAVIVAQGVFALIGAGWPAPRWYYWADAWIFVGSVLATYAMARGWTDFWLVWIAVDLVGIPLLWVSHYYPSAALYAVYGALVVHGFVVWRRAAIAEGGNDVRPETRVAMSKGATR